MVFAQGASAGYYLSARKAESYTRQHLHYDIGYRWTTARCRPQFKTDSNRNDGYLYHRWACSWSAGQGARGSTDCEGSARVRGSSSPGRYYLLVISKRGPKCR